jgi:hypothetical protein
LEIISNSISDFFKNYWDTQLHYLEKEEELNVLDWANFIKVISLTNIKTCGTRIEQRILQKNGWTKIKGQASHGDGRKPDGTIVEIKSSIITPLKYSKVTFRGIRPYHEVHEHLFILVDLSKYKDGPMTYLFVLSKDDIIREKDEFNTLRPYTMKKEDRKKNALTELGTSFKKGDLERWKELYTKNVNVKY